MFFENEVTRTLTMIEFLLVVIMGLAPVALTIWMKLVLYRRRVVECERDSLPRADRQAPEADRAGMFSDHSDLQGPFGAAIFPVRLRDGTPTTSMQLSRQCILGQRHLR
jgi:hypothetical protein